MSEKAAIQFFARKHAASSFIIPKICFGQLAPKLSSLSFILQKAAFLLFVCYNKGFLPVCNESLCYSLDFPQNHVFSCDWRSDNGFASFWQGYVVFSIILVRTASITFSLFNIQNTLFSALLHRKHVLALVTVKLGFFQRYCTAQWISFPVFCE